MSDDPLEKLAAQGRDLVAEDRARARRTRGAATTDAEKEKRAQIRSSVSAFARWGWWIGGGALGFGLGWAIIASVPTNASESDGDIAEVVAVEEDWLRGLPFPVVG